MNCLKHTPNNNQKVSSMLAKSLKKKNKGRNRILLCATMVSIMTLTMVFGISFGKVRAEYTKSVRRAGTTASGILENATADQYQKINSLSYIKKSGRKVKAGTIENQGKTICELSMLDRSAWEKIVKPAYTDIHGEYPEGKQEIMLSTSTLEKLGICTQNKFSTNTLEKLGIRTPETGMKIKVNVSLGWGKTVEETFILSGWFTSYTDDAKTDQGYVSEKKMTEWGFKPEENADVLFCQSDDMSWEKTEEKLYEDVERKDPNQKFTVLDTAVYEAVNQLTGSYEMSILGAVVILCGTFFLIYNVMQISMTNDVRQMGMLNTIGATRKQIRKIYQKQIFGYIAWGAVFGSIFSILFLKWGIPALLGQQYLQEYGGAKDFQIFDPKILITAIVMSLLMIEVAAERNIYCAVNKSCVESLHYTGIKVRRRMCFRESLKPAFAKLYATFCGRFCMNEGGEVCGGSDGRYKKMKHRKKRSALSELSLIAWRNITRQKLRFFLSVFSIFLGIEAILCTVVITKGSDASNIYEQKSDFTIIGQFCQEAQEAGGFTDTPQMESVDSFVTDGDAYDFMWDSYNDTFAPISENLKEKIAALDGVEQSTVAEGAFMIPVISKKGWSPVDDSYFRTDAEEIGNDMAKAGTAEEIRILNDEEIQELKQYVQKNHLKVDMESLENGTGTLFIHEHWFTPEQEKMTEQTVGEPVKFLKLMSGEEWEKFEETSKNIDELGIEYQQSEDFVLSGYIDSKGKDFPQIKTGWHGENILVFYVSEKGFQRLGTEKKTFYMEVNVKKEKEPELKKELKSMIAEENRNRRVTGTAEILLLSKSELLEKMSSKLQGNRMILGCISALLFLAGITNYFNVIITGIFTRKQELAMMENIGLTRKQKRQMLLLEGMMYFLVIEGILMTLGTAVIYLVRYYMQKTVTYFTFQYPAGWLLGVSIGLLGICLIIPNMDLIRCQQERVKQVAIRRQHS